jgi:DNA mismatch repair protein MLH3
VAVAAAFAAAFATASADAARRRLYAQGLAPPCVARTLHSKACRGAIMFGDALAPRECRELLQVRRESERARCSLLARSLAHPQYLYLARSLTPRRREQRLSLCRLPWQCAHGRPSMIPLATLLSQPPQ